MSSAIQLQHAYLRYLKGLSLKDVKRLHRQLFSKLEDTTLNPRIPPWVPRLVFERRLFLLFCLSNCHLKKGSTERKEFRKRTKAILRNNFRHADDSEDRKVKRALNQHSNFSRRRIKQMTRETVLKYLWKLGYEFNEKDLDTKDAKTLLWEYFNTPASETFPTRENRQGRIKALRKPRNREHKLKDVILAHPEMGWLEFVDTYGDKMPGVTHGSFRVTRCRLRKEGHEIPLLPRGRKKEEW